MYPSTYAGSGDKFAYSGTPMNITQGQPYNVHGAAHAGPAGNPWSTGLCHCCDDPANCLITCLCPCITFGQLAEIVNQGQIPCGVTGGIYGLLLGTGLACLYSCVYRSRLRAQHNLAEAPTADCLVHFCCEPCALCQEYRELKTRGFDMSIGWQANMDRRNRPAVITVAPPIGAMFR